MNINGMKVVVVSRESIKPSCPTPHHLRIFNLSFLDQIAPPIFVPLIFFYATDEEGNNSNKMDLCRRDVLKKSLSEILTRYYPLAGRIKDDSFIVDCNDDGVDYVEARVHNNGRPLSEFIRHPDNYLLKQFLPCEPYCSESRSEFGFNSKMVLAVQVSFFDCGGLVIGVCISHRMADACSLTTFMNDWAATTRGDPTEHIKGPRFDDLQSLFPQRDLMGYEIQSKIQREEIVTMKLVFEAPKIAELKKRSIIGCSSTSTINNCRSDYTDNIGVQAGYPTRVEAVSAFIWKRFMAMDQAKEGGAASAPRVYVGSHAVNMRARIVPPLPTNSMGNMYCAAIALSVINGNADDDHQGEKDHPYTNLVSKISKAIRKIDGDYVRELQTTNALLNSMKPIEEGVSSGQTVLLTFSSWCRFPIYEVDFGWGKPIWVSTGTLPFKNVVVFMDTRTGDGIEAWVNMTKDDMAEFERDEELLAFVSNSTDP